MFVSYAQNLEDVILKRVFGDRTEGTYVDVGASHPVIDSVTMAFYERGWTGVNIEPLPERIAELAYARPRDVNVRAAVAEAPGRATFHVFARWHGLSTLDGAIADDMRRWGDVAEAVDVEVRTLAEVLDTHGIGAIDFLKIDVEGAEARVLKGMDFARWRPVVVLVEATYPTTDRPSHADWEPMLLAAGYRMVLFDGLNRFYLRDESAALEDRFRLPPNHFDDYVRHRDRGAPLVNADHPLHGFAVHLASLWLDRLDLASDEVHLSLFGPGLGRGLLGRPIDAEALNRIWAHVFGRPRAAGEGAELLGRDPAPTGDAILAELLRSVMFRTLRSAVGRYLV